MVVETNESLVQQRRQLQELAHAYRRSQVLLTCVELGVFDALTAGSATVIEIAKTIQADARAVEILLNAATALGLVEKQGERFSNSAMAEVHLTRKKSGGMAHRLQMEGALYRRWGQRKPAR